MPVTEINGQKVWQRRTQKATLIRWGCWLLFLVILLTCWQQISGRTFWVFLTDAHKQAWDMGMRMFPPRWEYMGDLLTPVWDTVNIATLGTLAAVLLGTPLAFLAAKNTTPHASVRHIALLLIVSSRSINTLIWAILFVVLFGPGVLAGVLAITMRSVGFVGKLLYESIEEISKSPVEAIRAVGGTPPQVLTYGVFPQVFPSFIGISVFRWDINIRESTIVGLVGAGGIGLQLDASVNALLWSQVSLILIIIFVMVLFSEWLSATVRKAVI